MAGPFDATDWQKLARDDLDLGLNNGKAVAGSRVDFAYDGISVLSESASAARRRPSRDAGRVVASAGEL